MAQRMRILKVWLRQKAPLKITTQLLKMFAKPMGIQSGFCLVSEICLANQKGTFLQQHTLEL